MTTNFINADNAKYFETKEVLPSRKDLYVTVVFTLYNCGNGGKDFLGKEAYVDAGFTYFDNFKLIELYNNCTITKEQEVDVNHHEIFVDCSSLEFEEDGECKDYFVKWLKVLYACTCVEKWLNGFCLSNISYNVHVNVYSFAPIIDIASSFIHMIDPNFDVNSNDDRFVSLVSEDDSLFFEYFISKDWNFNIEYFGSLNLYRPFCFSILFNNNKLQKKKNSTPNQNHQPKQSHTATSKDLRDEMMEKDPFYFFIHSSFSGKKIDSNEKFVPGPIGAIWSSEESPKLLKAKIEYFEGYPESSYSSDDIVYRSQNDVQDITPDIKPQRQVSNNKKSEFHPFLDFLYSGLLPAFYLTHEGLKGTGYTEAFDNYCRSAYFAKNGDKEKSEKYFHKANGELGRGIEGTLELASWFPVIRGAAIAGGIFAISKHLYEKKPGHIVWDIIGMIPFDVIKVLKKVKIGKVDFGESVLRSAQRTESVNKELSAHVKRQALLEKRISEVEKDINKCINKGSRNRKIKRLNDKLENYIAEQKNELVNGSNLRIQRSAADSWRVCEEWLSSICDFIRDKGNDITKKTMIDPVVEGYIDDRKLDMKMKQFCHSMARGIYHSFNLEYFLAN